MTFAARNIGFSGIITGIASPLTDVEGRKASSLIVTTVIYNSDGTMSATVTGGGTLLVNNTHSWLTYTGVGNGTGFYLRVTPTVGSLTSNPLSTFTQMTSNQSITLQAGAFASLSCTYTLDIATDAGGTNIVSTQTSNIIAADGT